MFGNLASESLSVGMGYPTGGNALDYYDPSIRVNERGMQEHSKGTFRFACRIHSQDLRSVLRQAFTTGKEKLRLTRLSFVYESIFFV